jgi:lipoate-protein ligase A
VGTVPPDRLVTTGPSPLFDVEPLRAASSPTVGVPTRTRPAIVLGGTQDDGDLDLERVERDGVEVARRRGGGGAVLLRPGDCWVELWLPAGTYDASSDLRATAYLVGTWWQRALRGVGVETEMHRGGVRDADQGGRACFAGLGPGELTVDGDKLLGLSQWRTREGALVSCVACDAGPSDLMAYLAPSVGPLPMLAHATTLHAVGAPAARLVAAFCDLVAEDLGVLVVAPDLFA